MLGPAVRPRATCLQAVPCVWLSAARDCLVLRCRAAVVPVGKWCQGFGGQAVGMRGAGHAGCCARWAGVGPVMRVLCAGQVLGL